MACDDKNNKVLIEETVLDASNSNNKKDKVKIFTLKNKNEFSVSLISYAASIQSIKVKDINGKLVNVALGFDTAEEYENNELNPYFGASIGRVANRVSNGGFKLNGVAYNLEKNNGNHCLHGGNTGPSRKNWNSDIIENGVRFTYLSLDGEAGFPGVATLEASYILDPVENKLTVEYRAITEELTPINMTNHTYFNLDPDAKNIYGHFLKLEAESYLDFNPNDVTVTGKINPVKDTKYDFREYTKLADRIKSGAKWPEEGYDNFFILNSNCSIKDLKHVASVKSPSNGLKMDVYSNEKGVQFYTGNFLDIKASNNRSYSTHGGFCLELSNYPDSLNQESFPSCLISPDDEYFQKTVFSFSLEK